MAEFWLSKPPGIAFKGQNQESMKQTVSGNFFRGDDTVPLDETESDPGAWMPISLRYVETDDDFYLFFEVKNASETDALAPIAPIELLIEGDSYGEEEIRAGKSWVPAGESTFYQALNFFGGSLRMGDWDEERFAIQPDPYVERPAYDPSLIRVEGDRLYNDGDVPLGEVSFDAIVRDEASIYTATCSGPYTGAITPPSRSVRLSSALDEEYVPGCGFFLAEDPASEALEIGAPYRTEYVVVRVG